MDYTIIRRLWAYIITWIVICDGSRPQPIAQYDNSEEICQTEVFEAACPHKDQIIYTDLALYGRMTIGRCVQRDYGHVGCQGDVIRHTDRRCSGKRMCRIRIPDAAFDLSHPCPIEFKTYFLVSYKCLKITIPEEHTACARDQFLNITSQSGYIASITTEERGYGSPTCPWKIILPPGQRINITLTDFSTPEYNNWAVSGAVGAEPSDTLDRYSQCDHPYAILTERWSAGRTVRVCGGHDRERHIMLSRTNSVEVRIVANVAIHMGDENFFVFKYEAVGCPLPEAPEHGWVERDMDGALLGCNFTAYTWRLFCEGTEWVGPEHNCTSELPPTPSLVKWGKISLPYGVSVGVIVGLAIIMCVIVLLVGLICLEWRKMKRIEKADLMTVMTKLNSTPSPPSEEKEDHYEQRNSTYTDEPPESIKHSEDDTKDSEADYAYVREMWPLAPPAPENVNGENLFIQQSGLAHSEQSMLDVGFSPGGILTPGSQEGEKHIYESPRNCRSSDGVPSDDAQVVNDLGRSKLHQSNGDASNGNDNGFFEDEDDPQHYDDRYKPCIV